MKISEDALILHMSRFGIIPFVDIIKLNDDAPLLLSGSNNPEIVVNPLLALSPHIILLTLESEGS